MNYTPNPVAWIKITLSGTYLRTNTEMADTPEDFDGLSRHGWNPLYTASTELEPPPTHQGANTMSNNYRESEKECGGCGATATDRAKSRPEDPQGLSTCPHCNADKCCLCDMGDDVECGNCDSED